MRDKKQMSDGDKLVDLLGFQSFNPLSGLTPELDDKKEKLEHWEIFHCREWFCRGRELASFRKRTMCHGFYGH
jgi:hypothetical protein